MLRKVRSPVKIHTVTTNSNRALPGAKAPSRVRSPVETRKIVELCYRPPTKSAALKYLYQFFHAERDEILHEHKITSENSPFFRELFSKVRARFTLQ